MSVNIPSSQWRAQTIGGIPYKVVDVSGWYDEENAGATEVYCIEADRLADFAVESFPNPFVFLGNVFYPQRRGLPGFRTLRTMRIRWEGWTSGRPCDPFATDPNAPDETYEQFLKLTIDYGTSPENDTEADPSDPRTWLEISGAASGQFLAIPPRGNAIWESVNTALGETANVSEQIPQTVIQPEIEWTLRWPQIPFSFFTNTLKSRLDTALGKVNQSAMVLFNNAPAETILFLGYSIRYQYSWRTGLSGLSPVSLDLKFSEKNFVWVTRQVTHNHYYRPGWGWRRLLVDGVNPSYQLGDLDAIFRP